jgi:hypothetical protein
MKVQDRLFPSLPVSDVPFQALSVRQPWAWLLFHGKDIENRDWHTARRGPLAIHASAGMTRGEYEDAFEFVRRIDPALAERMGGRQALVLGALIGVVDQVDCVTSSPSPWFQGRFGHVYARPRLLETPIPATGRLGFWPWYPPVGDLRYVP